MRTHAVEKYVALIRAIRVHQTRRRFNSRFGRELRASVETPIQIGTRARWCGLKQIVEGGHVGGEHRGRPFDARPLHVVQ